MKKIIIAVDGYAACGKSTTAKAVAAALGYSYIDTGAMYRAVTHYFLEHFVEPTNKKDVSKAIDQIHISFHYNAQLGKSETFLNGVNVEKEIRTMAVSDKVSEVSALPEVRHCLVAQQQRMGKKKGIVMDGRDIGTTVFPGAELKIFVSAEMDTRARRRQEELLSKNELVTLDEIVENLNKRDRIDTTRAESPLRKAADAYDLDTTHLTIEEQVEIVLHWATALIAEA